MRIVHLLDEFPFPTNSGMRCDTGRRIRSFHELGHSVFAISWASARLGQMPAPEFQEELRSVSSESVIVEIGADWRSNLRRAANLRKYPSHIAARIPARRQRQDILDRVRAFSPDLIWLEGVHPSWLAWELKRTLGVPLVYRSHNVEHLYRREQAALSRSLRSRITIGASAVGLRAWEEKLQREADFVFDISKDDIDYWKSLGCGRAAWLPTQADPDVLATAKNSIERRDIDLLFIGGLNRPNNLVGLMWYLREVHPLVRAEMPDASLVVAGRAPTDELRAAALAQSAEVIADPKEAAPLFGRSKVMLNPILHGSGVNVKTIDMLSTGRPVVTTVKGARGLPPEVTERMLVADDPRSLANLIVGVLEKARTGGADDDRSELVGRLFGVDAVRNALDLVRP